MPECFVLSSSPVTTARHNQSRPRRLFHVAIEAPCAGHKEERDTDVGRHQRGVGQHVRIERHQRQRSEPRPVAERLPRRHENQQRKQQREHPGSHAHLKHKLIPVAVVVRQPFAAVDIRLGLEAAILLLRDPQRPPQCRQGCDQLRQRRMLRVQPVVARMPHHVAGKHVVAFIECGRLAMHHQRRQSHLYGDQSSYDSPNKPPGELWHNLPAFRDANLHPTIRWAVNRR